MQGNNPLGDVRLDQQTAVDNAWWGGLVKIVVLVELAGEGHEDGVAIGKGDDEG